MPAVIITMSLIILFFLGIVFIMYIKLMDYRNTIERQSKRINRLELVSFKSQDHAREWNNIWKVVKFYFNIYKVGGKYHGYHTSAQIFSFLRKNYGIMDYKQVDFVIGLIKLLSRLTKEQQEELAAMNPVDGIVFDGQGGFKLTPSKN